MRKETKQQKVNDGKDIYRKRFTPVVKQNIQKKIDEFQRLLKKIPAKPPVKRWKFIYEHLQNNEELRIVLTANPEELRPHLIELANHGGDIKSIYNILTLAHAYEYLDNAPPHALKYEPGSIYGGELNPNWNKKVTDFNEKKKKFIKKEKALKGALRLLLSLETVSLNKFDEAYFEDASALPYVNTKLIEAQEALKELERLIEIYLEAKAIKDGLLGYTLKWGWKKDQVLKTKIKPVKQSSHLDALNKRIFPLVEELKGIDGYTDQAAYKKAAELLHIAFPSLITDTDPNLIQNRYSYFKKKLSKKK
ncbi:MAG: hypothetical protein M1353_00595 [Nitrospirae bacterium]|nr:hypothetical protein [Nitrospirota bacterium]